MKQPESRGLEFFPSPPGPPSVMGFAISKQMNLRYPTALGKGNNHRLNVSLGGGYVSFLEGNCFRDY